MKLNSTNPWPIVRWGVVAVIYAGTVAIAVDQVRTRDREIAKLEKTKVDLGKSAKESLKLATKINDTARDQAKQMEEGLLKIQADLPQQIADAKLAGRLEVLQENLHRLEAAQVTPARTVSAYQPLSRNHVPSPAAFPSLTVSVWTPPAPSVLAKQIRDLATAKWGSNYEMVSYTEDLQNKGYQEVLGYYKTANAAIKEVLNAAAKKWPGNYEMMAYEIKNQLEAKAKLDGRR